MRARGGFSGSVLLLGLMAAALFGMVNPARADSLVFFDGQGQPVTGSNPVRPGEFLQIQTAFGLDVRNINFFRFSTNDADPYLSIDHDRSSQFTVVIRVPLDAAADGSGLKYVTLYRFDGERPPFHSGQVALALPSVPVITSNSAVTGIREQGFAFQVMADNVATNFLHEPNPDDLPAGLEMDADTGLISGTPTVDGTFEVNVIALNGSGGDTNLLTFIISPPAPVIGGELTVGATNGVAFEYQIEASHQPTGYSADGLSQITGLSLDTGTGLISGTPTVDGAFEVTIGAANGAGSDSATLNILVDPAAPVITSPLTADTIRGKAFSYDFTATGATVTLSVTGLPPGLEFFVSSSRIAGVPSESGTFFVTLTASNGGGTTEEILVLNVQPPKPTILSASTDTATVGVEYSFQVVATESPTAYGADGLSGTGLSIDNSTGLISGTPNQTGEFPITLTAVNDTGTGTKSFQLTINPSGTPSINSPTLAEGNVGSGFSYQITAENNPTSFSSGALPAGLALNSSTGEISGQFPATGIFETTITASNDGGEDTQPLTLVAWSASGEPPLLLGGGGPITLRWPASATDFDLEFNTTLEQPNWISLGSVPTEVNGVNEVTQNPSSGIRFYRLKKAL